MPLYTYECPLHGEKEIFVRKTSDMPQTIACEECGRTSNRIFNAPSLINVERDWNEKANEYQCNPYEQAKAQLRNLDRMRQEQGDRPIKLTDEAIQVAAREINKNKTGRKPNVAQRHIGLAKKLTKEIRKQKEKED